MLFAGALPRRHGPRHATALAGAAAQDPGGAAGPPGRSGLAGDRARAAAKMGSIAVDKAIAKLGTPKEFYQQLEPDQIAEHIVQVFEPDMPAMIDDIMRREHPTPWRDLPLEPVRP